MNNFLFFAKNSYAKAYKINEHSHPSYEVVYYTSGNGTVVINDQEYTFTKNTAIVTAPNVVHSEKSDDKTSVMFLGFNSEHEIPMGVYNDADKTLFTIFTQISKEVNDKKVFYERILDNLAENCIYLLLRLAKVAKKTPESFDYVLNYINSVATNNISIKQIAYNLGYHYDYFRQLFLQKMGITAKEYLLKEKLKLAISSLDDNTLSVGAIAKKLGFASTSHFCSTFYKHYNISPNDYRKEQTKRTLTDNHPKFKTD